MQLRDKARFRVYGIHQCYSMKQCEQMLTQSGFQIESARRFKVNWLWGVMTYRARTVANG